MSEQEAGTRKRMLWRKFVSIVVMSKSESAQTRTANSCYKDAADLHAQLEQYKQAVARYEQVADHSLTSALTKYSVKEYWLRSGLCMLAEGVGAASRFCVVEY